MPTPTTCESLGIVQRTRYVSLILTISTIPEYALPSGFVPSHEYTPARLISGVCSEANTGLTRAKTTRPTRTALSIEAPLPVSAISRVGAVLIMSSKRRAMECRFEPSLIQRLAPGASLTHHYIEKRLKIATRTHHRQSL